MAKVPSEPTFFTKYIAIFFAGFLFISCAKEGSISIPGADQTNDSVVINGSVTVTSVEVVNDRIIVRGNNLNATKHLQIKAAGLDKILTIQSKTSSELIAAVTSLPILSILPNQIFSLVISTANAQSVIPIQFVINNGTITGSKIATGTITGDKIAEKTIPLSKISVSGATTGQVATWDGVSWVPGTVSGGSGGGGITSLTFNNGFVGGPLTVTSPTSINIDSGNTANKIVKLDSVGDFLMPGLFQFNSSGALGFDSGLNEWRFFNLGGDLRISQLDATDVVINTPFEIDANGDVTMPEDVIVGKTLTVGAYTLPAADGANGEILKTNGAGVLAWSAAGGGGTVTSVSGSGSIAVATGTTTPVISISNVVGAGTYPKVTVNAEGLVTGGSSLSAGDIPSAIPATRISGATVDNTEFDFLNGVTAGIQTQFTGKEPSITVGTTAQYWRGDKSFQTLDTSVVPENTNQYFTDTRARTAAVADAINDATTNIAPSQNAVFDALALKANTTALSNYIAKVGDSMTGDLGINDENEIRFYENSGNGSNYVALKAPATLGGDFTFNLPNGSGTAGQVLSTNGSGILSWVSQSSGADNLGNHTATQTLNLNGQWINGDATATEGIFIDTAGKVGIGTATVPARMNIVTGGDAITGLMIKASATPTANLIEMQTPGGFVLSSFDAAGRLRVNNPGTGAEAFAAIGAGSGIGNTSLAVTPGNAGWYGQVIRALAGQSADLMQIQDSAGSAMSRFDASGDLHISSSGDSTIAGNLGIGTGSASAKLDILGTGTTSATKGLTIKDSALNTNLEVQDGGDVYTRQLLINGLTLRKQGANGAGFTFGDWGAVSIYGNSGGYSNLAVGSNGVGLKVLGAISNQTDRPVVTLANTDFGTQFSAAAGLQYFTDLSQTINQGGSAGYTMLDMDVTETTIGTGEKRLADFKVGGVSKFVVKNDGKVLANEYCDEAGANCKDASSGLYDNLGNHTATTTLNLNGQWINGDNTASEGMFIRTDGNVGIGTNNPVVPLQVNGRSTFTGEASFGGAAAGNTASIASGATDPGINSGRFLHSRGADATASVLYVEATTSTFGDTGGGALQSWNKAGVELMRVSKDGSVGIGTATPENKLTVKSNTAPFLDLQAWAATYDDAGIWMRYQNNATSGTKLYYNTSTAVTTMDNLYPNSPGTNYGSVDFRSKDSTNTLTSRLFIKGENGNVGIGTPTPSTPLNIKSANGTNQGLKVENSTGMYVIAGVNRDGSGYPEIASSGNHLTFKIQDNVTIAKISTQADSNGYTGFGAVQGLYVEGKNVAAYPTAIFKNLATQTGESLRVLNSSDQIVAGIMPYAGREGLALYNTLETNLTNFERLMIYPDSSNNIFRIDAQNGGTGSLRDIALQTAGGEVGIGTTAPTATLHLKNDNATAGATIRMSNNNGSVGSYTGIQANNAVPVAVTTGEMNFVRTDRAVAADADIVFKTYSNSTLSERMRIRDDGKVMVSELCDETGANCKDVSTGWAGGGNDNLGNHTASQTLNMNGQWINGDATATEGMFIDTAGNVGIGTGAPTRRLHINDGTFNFKFSAVDGVQIGTTGNTGWTNIGTLNTAPSLVWHDIGNTAVGAIDQYGRIGIGTAAPSVGMLHIESKAATDYPVWIVPHASQTSNLISVRNYVNNGYTFELTPNAVLRLRDPSNGGRNIILNTTAAANPRLEGNAIGTDFWSLGYGASNDLAIRSGGNIGIGQTAPATRLDVYGSSGTSFMAGVRNSAANDGMGFGLFSTNVTYTNPFTLSTAGSWNAGDPINADFYGGLYPWGSTAGGVALIGNSSAINIPAITFAANQGVEGGSNAPFYFVAATQVAGAKASIANGNLLLRLDNDGTRRFGVYGDGKVSAFEYCDENGANCKDASSGLYDNLGNHTATTTLNMNGQWLNGDTTASEGLFVSTAGRLGIGTASPQGYLDITANDGDNLLDIYFNNTISATGGQVLHFQGTGTDRGTIQLTNGTGPTFTYSSTHQIFNVSNNELVMRLDSGGNSPNSVSIGPADTAARATLQVKSFSGATAVPLLRLEHEAAPTTDYVQISSNGNATANIMKIDSAGLMGLGTASPVAEMHIHSPGDGVAYAQFTSSTTGSTLSDGLTIGYNSGGVIQVREAASLSFGTSDQGRMLLDANGRLGIGTVNPAAYLDIVAPTDQQLLLRDNQTNATNKTAAVIAGHYTNAEEKQTMMFMNSTATGALLELGGGVSNLNGATEIGFYTAANNTTLNGTRRMTIDSSGEVGIWTSTPSAPLHIYRNTANSYAAFQSDNATIGGGSGNTTGTVGSAADDACGGGSATWGGLAPSNLTSQDGGTFANANLNGGGTISHYLKATNHGFSVPGTATIDGIELTMVTRNWSGSATVNYYDLYMIRSGDGCVAGTDLAAGSVTGTAWNTQTFGGSTALWGRAWTPSDVNNSAFGMVVNYQCNSGCASGGVDVDFVRIKVYYTDTGGTQNVTWAAGTRNSNGSFTISKSGDMGSNNYFTLDTNGNLTVSGTVTQNSDARLKEAVTPLSGALEKILALEGVSYVWRDRERGLSTQFGMIAQDVQEIFPELVHSDGDGVLSVNYLGLLAPLVEAFKQQHRIVAKNQQMQLIMQEGFNARLQAAERAIASLKEQNIQLQNKVETLQTYLCQKDPAAPFCVKK